MARGIKKMLRSGRNKRKGIYERQRVRTTRNKNIRAFDRDKRITRAKEHPEIGSPSQIRNRKKRNKNNK